MDSTPLTLSPDATSLETAQANVKAAAVAQSALLNENLKFLYLGAFNNWKISVDAGRIDNTNPPRPPKSFVATDNGDGWFYPAQVGPAVCEMPPIPADHSKTQQQLVGEMVPNTIDIGKELGGAWFAAGPLDTWPPNKKTPPQADGHQYVKVCAAVGTTIVVLADGTKVYHGGWYEQVS